MSAEEVSIDDPTRTPRTAPMRGARNLLFLLLVAVALPACDTADSTASAPPLEAITSTTIPAPSPSTTVTPDAVRSLGVPGHVPPVIDGVLGDGEWAGSATVTVSDGSSLHWMHSEGALFVALESDAVGAVNLVISTADETMILHSSAALGSALYVRADGAWELSHGFDWCCRSATDDSARLQLLNEEGWQANIGFTGDDGIVEYEVTLPWDGAAVAVSYLTDSETAAFWPVDLSTEAREQLVGPPPAERSYSIKEWYTLTPVES